MLAAAVIPLGACLFAILEGSRLMAGLEKGGTLGLYLAYHPGRNRFLLTFYGALIIQLLGMGVVFWIIMNFAAWILNLEFGRGQLLANTMVCSLPAILFGTLAFSLGAATGRLWLSRWISSGAVLLISGWLAMAIFLPRFSFPGNKFLLQATRQPLFLLLCSLVLLGGGAWGFNRRDLQD